MALYLGNQKVSLRSGQDPTFDYGFDSNGRLVFANKNATEINNFLNYDSSYSEILDLSNLSKMEKVAVNGTADRKMEGLKGLLVSPNAPFTGSSPQINVSYTGLSKSALVSLFESAPYNVGYTKVGSPTIVDNVASNFSYTSYLKTSSKIDLYSTIDIEWYARFKTPSTGINGFETIFSTEVWDSPIVACYGANNIFYVTGFCGDLYQLRLNTDTYYRVKIVRLSADTWKGYVYSDEGTLLIEGGVYTKSISGTNKNIFIGAPYGASSPAIPEIDLNETYIKVNGVPWFRGTAAMTKTCSIVGATGTADLTQEDKNIILNKGWSLTVQ